MHDRSYPPCCALHQAREIIKADPTCPVIIQLNNLVDFFGAQMTRKRLQYCSQGCQRNESIIFLAEDAKTLLKFFSNVFHQHFSSHESNKPLHFYGPCTFSVNLCNHCSNFVFTWVLAQRTHDSAQLLTVDVASAVEVKQIKCCFQFRDLLGAEHGLVIIFRSYSHGMRCVLHCCCKKDG